MFSIGSDPEYAFARGKKNDLQFIPIVEIAPAPGGEFGSEGNYLGELRPMQSPNPLTHVENIGKLLEKYRQARPEFFGYSMFGYHPSKSTGGHIHIGIEALRHVAIRQADVSRALDSFLAFPFMFLENPAVALYRKDHYGSLSDLRDDHSWGIEYRTLSSWLASRRLAQGVMTLAYTIIHEVEEAKKTHNDKLVTSLNDFDRIYRNHGTDWLYPKLQGAIDEVRTMELYPKYREQIEYLFYHAKKQNHITMGEMRHGWKIPYYYVKSEVMYTLLQLTNLIMHEMDERKLEPDMSNSNMRAFITSDYMEHFDVLFICMRLNRAINKILNSSGKPQQPIKTLRIMGTKRAHGHAMGVLYNPQKIEVKKVDKMCRLMRDVATSLDPSYADLKFTYQESNHHNREIPNGGPSYMTISLPRDMRERTDFMAECIAFIGILYLNDSIYKTYQRTKKTGEKMELGILTQSFIKGIARTKGKKRLPKPTVTVDMEEKELGWGQLNINDIIQLSQSNRKMVWNNKVYNLKGLVTVQDLANQEPRVLSNSPTIQMEPFNYQIISNYVSAVGTVQSPSPSNRRRGDNNV